MLTKDFGFTRLKSFFGDNESTDSLSIYRDYFNYTSL